MTSPQTVTVRAASQSARRSSTARSDVPLDLLARVRLRGRWLVQASQHTHERERLSHRDRELLGRIVFTPAKVVQQPHAVLVPAEQRLRRAPLVIGRPRCRRHRRRRADRAADDGLTVTGMRPPLVRHGGRWKSIEALLRRRARGVTAPPGRFTDRSIYSAKDTRWTTSRRQGPNASPHTRPPVRRHPAPQDKRRRAGSCTRKCSRWNLRGPTERQNPRRSRGFV